MSTMFIVTVKFGSASREVQKLQSDTPAMVSSGNSCLSKAEVESSAIRRVMKRKGDEADEESTKHTCHGRATQCSKGFGPIARIDDIDWIPSSEP